MLIKYSQKLIRGFQPLMSFWYGTVEEPRGYQGVKIVAQND